MSQQAEAAQRQPSEALAPNPEWVSRSLIAERVARVVPGSVRHIVRFAVEQGDRPRSVSELAAAVGIPRKSLDRQLAGTIPVTARELLTWGRLIAVSMRLTDPSVTTSRIAEELAFASPSALRNLLQRYARLTPTELRRAGCTEHMVNAMVAALRATS
ncbi:MAG TPA: AraC family transcriptional regulator [Gemmatimonadaceae bacterium]|nr:AraC family transcriptional regulator [Gemmatimonadaceae bacterium]